MLRAGKDRQWPSSFVALYRSSVFSRSRRRASSISVFLASRWTGSIVSSLTHRSICRSRGAEFVLHLSEHHGDGTPAARAYVYMTGVEDLHRELIGKRYKYNRPGLQKPDWGMLETAGDRPVQQSHHFRRADHQTRRISMPELPEVETVRRGLAPAMEGARFDKVLAHRGDLRWPLPKDFAKRIEGTTVTGMGRRAKYLLADLSSGEVLVMHLGMSGSFHIVLDNAKGTPGKFHHERGKLAAHDHVVFHMSSGARGELQRSAPVRLDEAGGATRAWRGAAAARTRAGAARQRIRLPRCWRRHARARRRA